jgi:hypothetical protein
MTLAMFPVLVTMYVLLARREERQSEASSWLCGAYAAFRAALERDTRD